MASAAKVIHVEGEQFAHGLAENMAAQVVAMASAYSHIPFPATASRKNIAPPVAGLLLWGVAKRFFIARASPGS